MRIKGYCYDYMKVVPINNGAWAMRTESSNSDDNENEQVFVKQAGFGATIFLAFAVGYVLSLRTLSFDIIIPSVFVWACVSGVILASSGISTKGQIALRCAVVSAAFALSPIMFATLRGLLAAMSGDIPNMTNALGYGVINFSSFANSISSICIVYAILFFTSFILLAAATYAGKWVVFIVKMVFSFGEGGIGKVNATLLKMGAFLGIMGTAIVFVANLNKKDVLIFKMDGDTSKYDIATPSNGFLHISSSEVGYIKGTLFLDSDRSLNVLIPRRISDSIFGREITTELLSKPPCRNHGSQENVCVDNIEYGNTTLTFSRKLTVSGVTYLIVSSMDKTPSRP